MNLWWIKVFICFNPTDPSEFVENIHLFTYENIQQNVIECLRWNMFLAVLFKKTYSVPSAKCEYFW